jgi:hypothetical protein
MRLHLLTAVTRPENLPAIATSLLPADDYGIETVWHTRADPDRQSVGGQSLKNAMLSEIADGWVYILDDDNLMHPDFWRAVASVVDGIPGTAMVVLTQAFANGHVRSAHPGMLRSSHVDAGQVVIEREALGDARIPEHYCGDGDFIEALAHKLTGRIVFVQQACCYYNKLRTDQ